MNTLGFSIFINAPKEKVWDTMLQDETYRFWTKEFCPGSYYEGDWSEGSKILFLGPDENGKVNGGMHSMIAKNIPYEFVSIKHLGVIENGVEKSWSEIDAPVATDVSISEEKVEAQEEGFENYTFTEKDGGTQLDISLTNIPDSYKDMMNEMWPKALQALKELCER